MAEKNYSDEPRSADARMWPEITGITHAEQLVDGVLSLHSNQQGYVPEAGKNFHGFFYKGEDKQARFVVNVQRTHEGIPYGRAMYESFKDFKKARLDRGEIIPIKVLDEFDVE